MAVLYKYMKKEHAKLLTEQGKLRIGTLYGFRNEEKHGQEIGDSKEGTKSAFMQIGKETWTSSNQPEFTKSFFNISGGGSINVSGFTLEKPQNSPNFYIYCTTHEFDESAMRDLGYDSCIAIEQPERFFKCVSKSLKNKAKYQGSHKCKYQPRRLPHNFYSGVHPSLVKEVEYSYQKEVRSLWAPVKQNIEPIVIKSNNLKKHCRIIKIL